jgi:prephenate dehydrogenase
VGLGLIGGSLALALRRSGFKGRITAVSSPGSLAEGRRLGAIDDGADYAELPRAALAADLVVLATPIHRILEHLSVLGRAALIPGTVVTDVGSTKREILAAAARELPRGVHFVGGHPMAGSEKRGISAADPFLFENAYYVLTPGKECPPEVLDRLCRLTGGTGARVIVLPAEDHDRIAAAISHLPQLLAVALVNSLEELGPLRDPAVLLAAGGFRDMTRIASSPFEVWRDIIATNRPAIAQALGRFGAALAATTRLVEGESTAESEIGSRFETARATRSAIPRDTKGFLHPLCDVLVVVEDRPGVISRIAGALARKGINIQDIEVLKVREGEGGSLRLGLATRQLAEEAVTILAAEGFAARMRE